MLKDRRGLKGITTIWGRLRYGHTPRSQVREGISKPQPPTTCGSSETKYNLDGSSAGFESGTMDIVDQLRVPEHIRTDVRRRLDDKLTTMPRGQFDFCLIHSEPDLDNAAAFRDRFCSTYGLTGIMESDEEMANIGQQFNRIEEMINRSTKIFLFITEHFKEDYACILQKNELLAMHVRDKLIHIVPIYTDAAHTKFIPFGLSGMIGFKVYMPTRDNTRITNTFNEDTRRRKYDRQQEEKGSLDSKIHSWIPDILATVIADHKKRELQRRKDEERLNNLSLHSTFEEPAANSKDDDESEGTDDEGEEAAESGAGLEVNSNHLTNIGTAGAVHNGPVFNINVSEGATLHLHPKLKNLVNINKAGESTESESEDEEAEKNDSERYSVDEKAS